MKVIVIIFLFAYSVSSAQKFHFNDDVSVDSTFYPVPGKNSEEIYGLVGEWVAEKYKNPNAIKRSIKFNSIQIDGILRSAFSETSEPNATVTFDTPYRLDIIIQDDRIKNVYHHRSVDVEGKKSSKTLKDIVASPIQKQQYEENVQRMMNSLYMYVITH